MGLSSLPKSIRHRRPLPRTGGSPNKIALMMLIDQWRIQGGSLGSAAPPTPLFVVLRACVAGLVRARAPFCRFARMRCRPCACARPFLSFCAHASPASCARTSAVENVLDNGQPFKTLDPPLLTFFKTICVYPLLLYYIYVLMCYIHAAEECGEV